jgi:capsular polysaccharide transport system permease protein
MSKAQTLKLATADEAVDQPQVVAAAPVRRRWKIRHAVLTLSFVLLVVLPVAVSTYYLYVRASDQFHSRTAFSVRSEDVANPLEVLVAFTQTGATSAPDSAIIYDFLTSQTLVELIDAELDLRTIYNRAENDPVFTLGGEPSVEDTLSYWERMVSASVDANSGVLEIEVRAFTPEDATRVAEAIIAHSEDLVENLSLVAREDAMRYTLEDVAKAEARLKEMRRQIREFRTTYQIIDPEADVQSQVGILGALQSRLADSLIELATIASYSDGTDPRLPNIQRRVDAIRMQIENERAAVGSRSDDGKPLSVVIGEYEELLVDLEFAQNAYVAALAAEEQARIEANRRSRYLAVHIPPTLAQESVYPDRPLLLLVVLACAFATWGILVMIYYNVRDRR